MRCDQWCETVDSKSGSRGAPRLLGQIRRGVEDHVDFLWILLGVLYFTALVALGLSTLRKGHTALFWLGIIFPFLWIVGAFVQPTSEAAAADGGANLQ
jgi:hypothetical protein